MTIAEAGRLIRDGDLLPSTLTAAVLERLKKVQPGYHPFATLTAEQAMAEAELADAEIRSGRYRGPLHGIPLGIKDLIDVAGVPTRCGSAAAPDVAAAADATVVARLREAGAIILGKTVTHEYAFGTTSPPARCAWDIDCVPGGSSGGSAVAVATGVSFAALGTDTGSSVRNPASLNGIVGLKPTYGRVSSHGVMPCSWSCDHVGVLSKTVEDAALLLRLIGGRDPRDRTTADRPLPTWAPGVSVTSTVAGLRLGVPENFFFDDIRDDVREVVDRAIQTLGDLGATLIPVKVPAVEFSFSVAMVLCLVEGAALHRKQLREKAPLYTEQIRDFLHAGQLLFGTAYVDAQRVRSLIVEGLRAGFESHQLDALLTPTVPLGAVPVGREMISIAGEPPIPVMSHYARLTCPFNLCGAPAITVPCGFDTERHPVGLQIVGRPFDEDMVLRVAYAYQEATAWHRERPPLS
jgi:Asp-tRNA(Asn)/Glu-tRNA(Gln) amidotransferase A subunit family amidase